MTFFNISRIYNIFILSFLIDKCPISVPMASSLSRVEISEYSNAESSPDYSHSPSFPSPIHRVNFVYFLPHHLQWIQCSQQVSLNFTGSLFRCFQIPQFSKFFQIPQFSQFSKFAISVRFGLSWKSDTVSSSSPCSCGGRPRSVRWSDTPWDCSRS